MDKKIIITLTLASLIFSLASCGKSKNTQSQISGTNVPETASAQTADTSSPQASADISAAQDSAENNPSQSDSSQADNTSDEAQPTLAPLATPAPDSQEKAQQKLEANAGEITSTVTDSDGSTRNISLQFTLLNNTGIDFPALLVTPANQQLAKNQNILPEGSVFSNGQSISLNPGNNAVLNTTLFNIAGITSENQAYVYQNIDLSTSSVINLTVENGVPKAIIN